MFDILVTLITVIYVIICILMILIILLQAGRGGMGTALGGGASQSVFGGGGSSDVLAKVTQACAAGFMVFAMFLAYASAHSGSTNLKSKSDENIAEEMAAGPDEAVPDERIGPNPQPLPATRDPNAALPTPPVTDLADPADAPADAPAADAPVPGDAPVPADAPAPAAPAADAPTPAAPAAPAGNVAAPPSDAPPAAPAP